MAQATRARTPDRGPEETTARGVAPRIRPFDGVRTRWTPKKAAHAVVHGDWIYTTADERYGDLFKEIADICPEAQDLLRELDAVISVRLCETEDLTKLGTLMLGPDRAIDLCHQLRDEGCPEGLVLAALNRQYGLEDSDSAAELAPLKAEVGELSQLVASKLRSAS